MIRKSIIKIASILLIIGLNWTGLSAVIETFAYFNDTEDSLENTFSATTLDFSLLNNHIEDFIGMEAESDIEFASLVIKITGSLDVQYEVYAEKISGNEDFCNALLLEAEHNGIEKHDGTLLSLSMPATPQLGTWEFEIDLPVSATNVPHGAECNVDLVFKGWRSDVPTFEESGFTDEERIELRLTSRMIVLNEFLPNPNGLVPNYGFDFGDDNSTMPQGEWVELYNNSDFDYDLAGWYIWDDSGESANKIEITATNTAPPATVIGAHDWLVVYMNKEMFDNTGDTVKLFDNNDKLIDSYSYTDNDYCNVEPTPEDPNSTSGSGSCPGVPPNKSYGRIPDGIGAWFDPIPTPGGPNTLVFEQNNLDNIVESENDKGQIVTEMPEETPTIEEGDTDTEELFTTEESTPEEDLITEDELGAEPSEDSLNNQTVEESTSEEEPVTDEETTEGIITDEDAESGGTDEAPVDEVPVVEEQPATLPDESASNPDGSGESASSGGSGDGGSDTSGSLDSSNQAEGAGESSGDSGVDAGGESVSE